MLPLVDRPPAPGVAFSVLFSVLCLVHAAFKAPTLLARPCDPGHQLYFVCHHRDSLSTLNSAAFWFYLGLGPHWPWHSPPSICGQLPEQWEGVWGVRKEARKNNSVSSAFSRFIHVVANERILLPEGWQVCTTPPDLSFILLRWEHYIIVHISPISFIHSALMSP